MIKDYITQLRCKFNNKFKRKRKFNVSLPGIYVEYTVFIDDSKVNKVCFIPDHMFIECKTYDEAYKLINDYIELKVVPWTYKHELKSFEKTYNDYMNKGRDYYEEFYK